MPKTRPKVSFYCTVLNEQDSIGELISSLYEQTYPISEIIVVDGGSTDGTLKKLQEIKSQFPLKIIEAPGSNVAQARNIGIDACKHDIIVSSDADCKIDKDWVKNLVAKFDAEIDVVSGFYKADAQTVFEECVSEIILPKNEEITAEDFIPSNRSLAIRKKVGTDLKLPENLYRSEDTWFGIEAKKKGYKFALAKDAVVYWRPRKNLRELFYAWYQYKKSDVANNVNINAVNTEFRSSVIHIGWAVTAFVLWLFTMFFVSWIVGVIVFPLFVKSIFKNYGPDSSLKKTVYKNIIMYTLSLAVIFGYMSGMLNKGKNVEN